MTEKKFLNEYRKILKDKGTYSKTDDILITELFFQLSLLGDAKKDVIDRGFHINVRKDKNEPPLYNVNQSVSVVSNATRQIQSLLKQLGLSAIDNLKLEGKAKSNKLDINNFLDNKN